MNEFVQIREMEQAREMSNSVQAILSFMKKISEDLIELKKGQTTIREELRNIDKLRPLRNK